MWVVGLKRSALFKFAVLLFGVAVLDWLPGVGIRVQILRSRDP